jgi:arylsulfatase A-like enzyme
MPQALLQLEQFDAERFFFFLHTYDVHTYSRSTPSLPEFLRPYRGRLLRDNRLVEHLQHGFNEEWLEGLTADDLDYLIDLYDAEIRYVDTQLAWMAENLKRLGLWERSILVITSDHGEEFMEHGRTGHGFTLFDEQARIPLIIRLPRALHGGTRVADQVRAIDVMPTVLELLGIRDHETKLRGESLVPLFTGSGAPRLAYTDPGHRGEVSVRTPAWKVIFRPGLDNWSAFDLPADPGEQHPLRGDELPPEPRRLLEELQSWREETTRDATHNDATPLTEAEREELRALGYLE